MTLKMGSAVSRNLPDGNEFDEKVLNSFIPNLSNEVIEPKTQGKRCPGVFIN